MCVLRAKNVRTYIHGVFIPTDRSIFHATRGVERRPRVVSNNIQRRRSVPHTYTCKHNNVFYTTNGLAMSVPLTMVRTSRRPDGQTV
jgi:hypothetical protein